MGIQIDEDGGILIYRGDDPDTTVYARLRIESFVELIEIAEAFLNPQVPPASNAAFGSVRMSVLLEDIYCPILIGDRLRVARWADAAALFPGKDVCRSAANALTGEMFLESGWWCDACRAIDPTDARLFPWNQRDIVMLGTNCNCPAATYQTRHLQMPTWHDFGVVLRLNAKASVTFLLDVLRHSHDAENIREELAAVKSWKEWIRTKQIAAPSSRFLQIHQSIAFRNARETYLCEVARLSRIREPLHAAPDLFDRRTEMVQSLHNEMLVQVESLIRPLPFFIEYPYAQFIGTADRGQRIRHAQFLLNILCKMLILLPLEELQQAGDLPERIQTLVTQLRERPASDGTLRDLGRDLAKIVVTESLLSRLRVFGSLVTDAGNNLREHLGTLISARNRMQHPPFDENGFLAAAATTLPEIVGQLRETLRSLSLIVPKQVRPTREHVTVQAVKVMGENPGFKSFEFTTSLPAGDFITDELAAYRSDEPEALVSLNYWCRAKTFSSESLDVGFFDRMEREGPAYSFITH